MADNERPPGRATLGMRHMIGAMIVLLLIIGVVLLVSRACEFSPGGPSVDPSSAPSVDAGKELRLVALSASFSVRSPSLPAGWRANSASSDPVGDSTVVRVGWLTPGGAYAQLSQSGGSLAEVVDLEVGREKLAPDGAVDVDGVEWTRYPGRRDESAWAREVDGTVLVVTGNASEADFRVLAAAAQEADPLPR